MTLTGQIELDRLDCCSSTPDTKRTVLELLCKLFSLAISPSSGTPRDKICLEARYGVRGSLKLSNTLGGHARPMYYILSRHLPMNRCGQDGRDTHSQ